MIQLLSPAQTKILLALARYKFLTTSQMITLGISNRRSNLSVMLKPLKESKRALVGEMEFGFVPSKGRLENFYYLKPRGKKVILESGRLEEDEIKYPRGRNVMFTQDYFHRKYTIDCHIACDLAAKEQGFEVLAFDRYFDKVGNNRTGGNLQARTKIDIDGDYIIADATLLLKKGDITRLYALELYNDRNVKRITAQIEKHLIGIRHSSLCKNYGIKKGHRLICVFSHPETRSIVMEKFDNSSLKEYTLFYTADRAFQFFTNLLL